MASLLSLLHVHTSYSIGPPRVQQFPYHILRIPRIADVDEIPSSEAAVIVDGRHPQGAGGLDFGGFV